jgi:hypothetical protein
VSLGLLLFEPQREAALSPLARHRATSLRIAEVRGSFLIQAELKLRRGVNQTFRLRPTRSRLAPQRSQLLTSQPSALPCSGAYTRAC